MANSSESSILFVSLLSFVIFLLKNPNDVFHEKFIILVTDGPPCDFPPAYCSCVHNNDLWQLADKLEKEKFTLGIIGIEKSVNVCADFYCALAKKTGWSSRWNRRSFLIMKYF